jgi:NADPH:quinone reductase-like Zn-dependent oxidoreductase
LEPRIIAFSREACSGREKPFLFRPQRVAVQLASQAGATVIAVVSGTQRRGRLRELGADHVVDRTKDNIVDSVRQYTHGTGVDLVIDPVGTTLPVSLSALAPEGRLVFVGNAGGGSLTVDLWPAMQSNQTLMGVFMGPLLQGMEFEQAWTRCCRL